MPKIKNKKRKLIIQLVEYLVSGGAYFISGYVLFAVLWSGLAWSLWWAKITANIFGWTVNFLLQRYWVFKNPHLKGHLGDVSARYITITLIDFVMDYLIVYWLRTQGITPYIGQFMSAGFFTIWNYIWYRYWVFPVRIPAPRHPGLRQSRSRR